MYLVQFAVDMTVNKYTAVPTSTTKVKEIKSICIYKMPLLVKHYIVINSANNVSCAYLSHKLNSGMYSTCCRYN